MSSNKNFFLKSNIFALFHKVVSCYGCGRVVESACVVVTIKL